MRRGIRSQVGESRIIEVKCTAPDGIGRVHKARVAVDGHIAFLDHERGSLRKSLQFFRLAGVPPTGCYALLRYWQQAMQNGATGRIDLGGGPVETSTADWALELTRAVSGLHTVRGYSMAAENVRKVRLALHEGRSYARRVSILGHPGPTVWALAVEDGSGSGRRAVDGLFVHGVPRPLSVPIAGGVARWGGFVAARPRRASEMLLWSLTIPGVSGLLARGDDLSHPGVLALLRLTARILAGWSDIILR